MKKKITIILSAITLFLSCNSEQDSGFSGDSLVESQGGSLAIVLRIAFCAKRRLPICRRRL